ncbi:MAG: DUF72 domain-containing protein [Fidelibacterota bacterium]
MDKIRVGTSGYSFQDWKGPFYPPGLSDGEMLPFYARHFSCVEINSTYYRIPHFRVFEHLVKKTPDDFEFMVKVHAQVTHARKDPHSSITALVQAAEPLMDSGKFTGFLAQFPYSFKNRAESRKYLADVAELAGQWPLYVEFRHKSWDTPPLYDFLKRQNVGYVNVDEPELPNLLPRQCLATTDVAYVRFHGRNRHTWWNGDRGERYDYHYSKPELEPWKRDIAGILDRVMKIYLFFNNCYHGQAAQNALEMKALLTGI